MMKEGFAFIDEVPYGKGSTIERQRYERRGAQSVIAELGAQEVRTQELISDEATYGFQISGIVPPDADGERIREILKKRGGKKFTTIPFITK